MIVQGTLEQRTGLLVSTERPTLETPLIQASEDVLFRGKDIFALDTKKLTPSYIVRVSAARLAHANTLRERSAEPGTPITYGEGYKEKERYSLWRAGGYDLKKRWVPSLIFTGDTPGRPEEVVPILRLDSLILQGDARIITKTATDPLTDNDVWEMVTGLMKFKLAFDGRDYTLYFYTTPEALDRNVRVLRRKLRDKRFRFEPRSLPYSTAQLHDAAKAAYAHTRQNGVYATPQELSTLRLVN